MSFHFGTLVFLVYGLQVLEVMSFSQDCTLPNLKNGRIKVREGGRSIRYKCKRRFTLVSDYSVAICLDNMWFPKSNPVCVKRGCDNVPSPDNGYRIYKHGRAMATFFCNIGHDLIGSSVLICDGSAWNGTEPTCSKPILEQSLNCSFTHDTCYWGQPELDELFWVHSDNANRSFGTGPLDDHAGPYMILESSQIEMPLKTASLYSPLIQASDQIECLSLAINMNGLTMGSLSVYQIPDGAGNTTGYEPLWQISGNQGPTWHQYAVKLPSNPRQPYQIVLEGQAGLGYLGDIAVDEVLFYTNVEFCRYSILHNPSPIEDQIPVQSPVSCVMRCGIPERDLGPEAEFWQEGICSCEPACLLEYPSFPVCCSDYVDECHYHLAAKFDDRGGVNFGSWWSFWLWMGIALCFMAMTIVAVSGGRLRACHRARKGQMMQRELELDSDMRHMVNENEDIDDDEVIDFTLATPSTLQVNLVGTHNRKISSI
ncbi:MAM and LDL-receptor class A domain-containing protein 2-like [Tigriopus californicus]|uniref:MAM and LDL-receptor class A domain-containing protein 2-like n=1 Tax=Tigriopus californicus TaxID=6832 RepID=UPI0027DA8CDB|nr:MAM and LDL-receptor class A domain-containing protein 2-like [Tigriopus californicus]